MDRPKSGYLPTIVLLSAFYGAFAPDAAAKEQNLTLEEDNIISELLAVTDGGCGEVDLKKLQEITTYFEKNGKPEIAKKINESATKLMENGAEIDKFCGALRGEIAAKILAECKNNVPDCVGNITKNEKTEKVKLSCKKIPPLPQKEMKEITEFKAGALVGGKQIPEWPEQDDVEWPPKKLSPEQEKRQDIKFQQKDAFQNCVDNQQYKGNLILGTTIRHYIREKLPRKFADILKFQSAKRTGARGK